MRVATQAIGTIVLISLCSNFQTFNMNVCLSGGQHAEVKNFINAGVLSGVSDAEVPENYENWRNHDFPKNYRTK